MSVSLSQRLMPTNWFMLRLVSTRKPLYPGCACAAGKNPSWTAARASSKYSGCTWATVMRAYIWLLRTTMHFHDEFARFSDRALLQACNYGVGVPKKVVGGWPTA